MWPFSFQRGQIVGAWLVGAYVMKAVELSNVSWGTISTTMTAYSKYGKTSSAKKNNGPNLKLTDKYRRTLKRIVTKQHKITATKITEKLHTRLSYTFSTKIVQ